MGKKHHVTRGARTIAQKKKFGGKGKHIHGSGYIRDKGHTHGAKNGKGK